MFSAIQNPVGCDMSVESTLHPDAWFIFSLSQVCVSIVAPPSTASYGSVELINVTAASGVKFSAQDFPYPPNIYLETMGATVAFDYDNDGIRL